MVIVSLVALSLVAGVVGTAMAAGLDPSVEQRGGRGAGIGFALVGIPDSIGNLLGLSPEQIVARRHEGQSLVDIDKNMPQSADEIALVERPRDPVE